MWINKKIQLLLTSEAWKLIKKYFSILQNKKDLDTGSNRRPSIYFWRELESYSLNFPPLKTTGFPWLGSKEERFDIMPHTQCQEKKIKYSLPNIINLLVSIREASRVLGLFGFWSPDCPDPKPWFPWFAPWFADSPLGDIAPFAFCSVFSFFGSAK